MKKPSQKTKNKKSSRRKKKNASLKKKDPGRTGSRVAQSKKQPKGKPVTGSPAAKPVERTPKKTRTPEIGSVARTASKVGLFLREAKMELKKVKWPTRKELIASTAVVIVLTLFVAFYLGLIDFGLIKIIKNVVG